MTTTYQVTVERDGPRWWLIRVPELDVVTQARRLDQVEATVRDLIALVLEADDESFGIAVEVEPAIADLVRGVERARVEAAEAADAARVRLERAVGALREEGLTVRDVGVVLGLSYQRIAQIEAGRAAGTVA